MCFACFVRFAKIIIRVKTRKKRKTRCHIIFNRCVLTLELIVGNAPLRVPPFKKFANCIEVCSAVQNHRKIRLAERAGVRSLHLICETCVLLQIGIEFSYSDVFCVFRVFCVLFQVVLIYI